MALQIEALHGKTPVGNARIVTGREVLPFASENPDEGARGFVQVLHHDALRGEQQGEVLTDVISVGFDDRLTRVRTRSKQVLTMPVDYRRENMLLTKDGQSVEVLLVGGPGPFGEGITGYCFTRVPEQKVA